ncbi:MAG: response regulator [Candidatus Solibacter sp.]
MAGERILIVDDTPVNLKLTRILLVNEGYAVRTAASAEEALEVLPAYQPRLILADIQLPGMDGLEMTRKIKGDPRTRNMIVIALTAFAMMGDESRASEAGCDGYITKPIDTRTLGAQIRELLAKFPGDEPAGATAEPPEALPAVELQALRSRFLEEGQQAARQTLLDLDGLFDPTDAARAVHQWVGTGGLLGYPSLSRGAREVEMLLRERPLDTAQVRESLTNLLLAFDTPPEVIDAPVPEAIRRALAGRLVALAGLPASETQRLGVALERARARAVVLDTNTANALAQLDGCDLIAAYIRPDGGRTPWTDPAAPLPLPVVFVGDREDILALDPCVQALAADFLMDAWQPDEALVRLGAAIARFQPTAAPPVPGPIRVLVADGDAVMLEKVWTALQQSGIEVHLAADGIRALEIIRSLRPQAVILSAALPGLDGYAVLEALRAEGLPVRVMLLAARQHESDVFRGFELGAGDYVVTPVSPVELVARLKRLIAK